MALSEKDRYWLAGILEGEGCFTMSQGNARILLGMKDRDVVERVQNLVGAGSICVPKTKKKESHSEMFLYTLSGVEAISLMGKLKPIMSERRRSRIDEVINLYWYKRAKAA